MVGVLVGSNRNETIDRAAEIETFAGWWFDNAHWPSITMSSAIAWLRERTPSIGDMKSIIHNDMIFHNILADETGITAILDWEQASIGHPGEDLGYAYPTVSRLAGWERFLNSYYQAGGPHIRVEDLDFFIVRAQVRLMGLVLISGRHVFEQGGKQPIIMASAGAHFTQRLMHRIAMVLDDILSRS